MGERTGELVDGPGALSSPVADARERARRLARAGLATVALLACAAAAVLGLREGVLPALLATRWWGIVGALALAVASALAEGLALAVLRGDARPRAILGMTRAYVAGGFVGSVTPYALGGAPAWLWALAREGMGAGEAAALVLGRSAAAAVFFALMTASVPLLLGGGVSSLALVAVAVPAAVIAALVWALRDPARAAGWAASATRRLGSALRAPRMTAAADAVAAEAARFVGTLAALATARPLAFAGALGAIALSRAGQLAAIPLLLAAQGHPTPSTACARALVLVWVVASVTPAPSGEGVAQAAIVRAFGPLSGAGSAAAAALAWRASVFYPLFIVGGVLFARLVRTGRVRR